MGHESVCGNISMVNAQAAATTATTTTTTTTLTMVEEAWQK
jgi:hypothetical protein